MITIFPYSLPWCEMLSFEPILGAGFPSNSITGFTPRPTSRMKSSFMPELFRSVSSELMLTLGVAESEDSEAISADEPSACSSDIIEADQPLLLSFE